MAASNCETCVNFVYDEDYMVKFLSASFDACPYYQLYDEYKIVRRQM